jgi:hypothetical protein
MLTATYCFLGIAGFILLALACVSMGKPCASTDGKAMPPERPTWNKNAEWSEIKATWMSWSVQCQEFEAPKRKAMLSWGRTMALCAVLCLVGVYLEVEYGEKISFSRIWSGFKHQHPVANRSQTPQPKPSGSTSIPTTNRSAQK